MTQLKRTKQLTWESKLFFKLGPHTSRLFRPRLTTSSSDSPWRSSVARVCSAETMSHNALKLALRNSTSSLSFMLPALLLPPRPVWQNQIRQTFLWSMRCQLTKDVTLCGDVIEGCKAQNDNQAEFYNGGPSHLLLKQTSKSYCWAGISLLASLRRRTKTRLFTVLSELTTKWSCKRNLVPACCFDLCQL